MNSKEYWAKREAEQLKHNITEEKEYDKQIERIYTDMLDNIQKEIDSFYGKYASKEGITLAEAKKRVKTLDIATYERKAKRYVKEKDFSDKANEEMRLYNATMKINRLEMLKANIGLELISGSQELEKFMADILQGRTEAELKRQAGILGKTIKNNAQKAHAIVNGSFQLDSFSYKGKRKSTFSDAIWQYQDLMRSDLGELLRTGLIRGKNPRALAKDLNKMFFGADPKKSGGYKYCAERLMRTELARVQTEAQKQSFERNGFSKYTFIVNGGCCDICAALNGKHFDVAKMMPGENAPPIHPHCRCSTAAYEDSKEYDAWLDFLDKGGTTEEFNSFRIHYKASNNSEQNYKPVTLDENNKINTSYKELLCSATKAIGYNNDIYISDKVKLKPKQLNFVNNKLNKAANMVGAEAGYKMPRVIICDSTELPTKTVAAYTASDNTLRISSIITTKQGILNLPKDGACSDNENSIYIHEMLHWSDAQKYIKKHGNSKGYLEANKEEGKINIDNAIKNGYNIDNLSEYAKRMLEIGRYDEVWAEYRTAQMLKG